MDHPCSNRGPGNNRMRCTKFYKGVPRVPKCVLRWESTTNHFLMGSLMKLFTIADNMGVPTSIGRDVPNFMKDVPNFVKDVPRVPKCFPRWR